MLKSGSVLRMTTFHINSNYLILKPFAPHICHFIIEQSLLTIYKLLKLHFFDSLIIFYVYFDRIYSVWYVSYILKNPILTSVFTLQKMNLVTFSSFFYMARSVNRLFSVFTLSRGGVVLFGIADIRGFQCELSP